MNRRQFLRCSGSAGIAIASTGAKGFAESVDAQIEILLDEPTGIISPNLYGQFTEHIGGVIYDGVWVGGGSKIPNRFGIRSELIDRLKEIRVPVIRWPGGCFADSYDWMDGVGPSSNRPTRTNFWEVEPELARLHEQGVQIFESNRFGTNEFMRFCTLSGAQPYVAANLRSLPASSFDHWVEYCNSPKGSTTLAQVREAAGFPEPFHVRYWGVGNESWGCGGSFQPEAYASEFRRFTTWVPKYGVDLQFIASGPNNNDLEWTHRFFDQLHSGHAYRNENFAGWSVHYYVSNLSRGKSQDWTKAKGDAVRFDQADWYEVLRESSKIEQIIDDQWSAMGAYDPDRRIKLVVDEYGPWYREGTEVDPTHLFGQQITIRDALATALTLDTFNRRAEKVGMANNAQLVNNLNALFLAHEDRFVVTPNFHVFSMYAAHQGGQGFRVEISAPEVHYVRDDNPAQFWGLNGSASLKDGIVTLTVVNPDLENTTETRVAIRTGRIDRATATVLRADDMHAHNTFDTPDAVRPAPLEAMVAGQDLLVRFPPASVSKLEIAVR